MKISWTIMLTQGPLVGEVEAEDLAEACWALDEGLRKSLGDNYTAEHAQAVSKVRSHLETGATDFRSAGVWVQVIA